jgi:hypothetical protein
MANFGKWNIGAGLTTVLSTGLNTLATNTMSAASSTYVNQTNLDLYCDLEVFLASFTPTAAAPYVTIYVWGAIDGSTFPAQSDADLRLTSNQLFCVVPIGTTAATAQRVMVRNLLLPPEPIQFKLDNQTGASLAATLNTVKINTYNYNLNG